MQIKNVWLYLNQHEAEYMKECEYVFCVVQIKVDAANGWNVPGDCDRLRSTMPIYTSWHCRNTPLQMFL